MLDLKTLNLKLEGKAWKADETSVSGRIQETNTNLFGLSIPSNLMEKIASKEMLIEQFNIPLNFPKEFDLRNINNLNYTTSIKDQGECNACVAFALCAVWETQYKLLDWNRYRNIDLSEAYLFFCSGQKCDKGWDFEGALRFALSVGTCDESCFPYKGIQQKCQPCSDYNNRLIRIKDWNVINDDDLKKYTIFNHGPLLAGMEVYEDFTYYKNGIYEYVDGNFRGNHAIAVIGYNDTEGFWICKNSWGKNWGENGWFRIKYDECNINFYPMFKVEIV